ncbi:MAG: MFS transporter [bacterium]|nr:MFS transporter [bacterium]
MKTCSALRRNVVLCYAHATFASGFGFMAPTLVLYWTNHGISVPEASILEGMFALVLATFAFPNGYLADRKGRKKAVVVGSFLLLIASGFYLFCGEF